MKINRRTAIVIAAAAAVLILGVLCVVKRDVIIPGWHTDGDVKYYIYLPFKKANGLNNVGGDYYLFSEDEPHALLYGFNKFDGKYYYSLSDGKIAKGEIMIDGEKYTFDASTGEMRRNNIFIVDGKLWFYDDHGNRQFGIIEIDGNKYCFSESGNLRRGLVEVDGRTYYFDPESEAMIYGWKDVSGSEYYFGDDGAALTGENIIDGEPYYFDSFGRLQKSED